MELVSYQPPICQGKDKKFDKCEELVAYARADSGLRSREVFIPFCYVEAAANLLTNAALDPVGKIPEFKYCAVRLAAA